MFNYTIFDPAQCEFIPVAGVEDLPNGERMFIEIDHETMVIFNIAGQFFAIADVCSHDNGPLGDGDLEGEHQISCPRHGGKFDVRTGKALTFPAVEDIPAYPVRVMNGEIEIGLPLQP
ncbi:MAG TPA: non-heme iron oxygenase ferredoxin subunit [Anaerolineales bacterium]|nr:non-heme iron oxygenase ferredoxin subunit [Anaerolineales bacterium]